MEKQSTKGSSIKEHTCLASYLDLKFFWNITGTSAELCSVKVRRGRVSIHGADANVRDNPEGAVDSKHYYPL